jgi:hypothetical protein
MSLNKFHKKNIIMNEQKNFAMEVTIKSVTANCLKAQGADGPLAEALVNAAIAILEVAHYSTDEWAKARANAVCKKIADALGPET